MAAPCRGSTTSGLPGKSRRQSRKRYPSECSRRRTINSGPVSRPLIARMFSEREAAKPVSLLLMHSLKPNPVDAESCRHSPRMDVIVAFATHHNQILFGVRPASRVLVDMVQLENSRVIP